MTRARWHIEETPERLLLARRLPARFDVQAGTVLPRMSKRRLAHQVRQDMWRALQRLRGFSPVVSVADHPDGVEVIAGGQVSGPVPRTQAEAAIADVLADPANRARWTAHARRRAAT